MHEATEEKSCDTCDAQEDRHYCLIHSVEIKNMELVYCDDWCNTDITCPDCQATFSTENCYQVDYRGKVFECPECQFIIEME